MVFPPTRDSEIQHIKGGCQPSYDMVLKKGTDGVGKFGYQAGYNEKERKAPVTRWKSWAAHVTVPLLSDTFVKKRSE